MSLNESSDSILKYSRNRPPKIQKLGPLVFACSEYRGISKAGGISVMVADLTQQLAILGERIIVVTPLYSDIKKDACQMLKEA